MKLWLSLACGLAALFAWLALRGGPAEAPPVAMVRTTAAPAPIAAPATPAALPIAAPTGVRVHGVLQKGSQPQALMSIEGQPAHVFGVGDTVVRGWSLASVAADHVMLAQGDARARLDVSYSVSAPPAVTPPADAAAQPVPVGLRNRTLVKDDPLPGFVKTEAGSPVRQPNPAANRRFLEDHQKRMAAGKP